MSAASFVRRSLDIGFTVLVGVLVLGACGAVWFRGRMVASLPRLDGSTSLAGLSSPVTISRDALGVVTISGASRIDVARATGWVNAQDRFFQMDLLRRRGAGELSELFGKVALPVDRQARVHGFRKIAHEVFARETPEQRALLEAYTAGVNAGLAALAGRPWEYLVLRSDPRPWLPEDCGLISFAMTQDLQEDTGRYVRTLAAIRDELGPSCLAYFAPLITPADSALDGTAGPLPPLPPPSEIDLRKVEAPAPATASIGGTEWGDRETPGSNNFAVAGRFVEGGGAMIATDMHLHLAVPNIWYRVSLRWPGHVETGLMIPGAPMMIAGSTGKIAWGFTNSNAGTGDIIVVNPSISPTDYHGPKGELLKYEEREESIAVRGSSPDVETYKWTIWGPVVGDAPKGRLYVYHWTADDPAAMNPGIVDLEDATSVAQAIEIAHRMGIPAQNFVVADSTGQIGWTVAGLLPKRLGYDGRLPVTWDFGDRRWDGFLTSKEVPSLVSPANGLIWTANNRTVGGDQLRALGDSGYDMPARAHQIQDDLGALVSSGHPIAAKDLLAIQLDDRALMMAHWHDVLVEALKSDAGASKPGRSALLEAAQTWEGRADISSVSYRVVHDFRLAVAHRVLDPIFAPCVEQDAGFTWSRLNYEQPLEALVQARPAHLLDPAFHTWDELLLAAADDVTLSYSKRGLDPRSATWGQRNTARIEHPFAQLLPHW
ncbi:MAG TPA: penicillin acylase family protein, partial [Opitutaceae bacterium]|nr:penicillin acylase family protein [Opitutaceae bacterium]